MRFRKLFSLAALTPLLVSATQPVILQPSTRWILDYADNSCRLTRQFGSGETAATLLFESDAPDELDMLVIGRPFSTGANEVSVRFPPNESKSTMGEVAKAADNKSPAILWSAVTLLPPDVEDFLDKLRAARRSRPGVRPPPLDPSVDANLRAARLAFAARAMRIEIATRRNRPVILATGSLGEPIRMLDKCSRDSLRDWGVDPSLEDRVARRVWSRDPSLGLSPEDYPTKMLRSLSESVVKFRLLVDASGKVTKCTALSHFDAPEFNRVVCDKITQRAKFEPAELQDGTKVPFYYVNRVIFRIGG